MYGFNPTEFGSRRTTTPGMGRSSSSHPGVQRNHPSPGTAHTTSASSNAPGSRNQGGGGGTRRKAAPRFHPFAHASHQRPARSQPSRTPPLNHPHPSGLSEAYDRYEQRWEAVQVGAVQRIRIHAEAIPWPLEQYNGSERPPSLFPTQNEIDAGAEAFLLSPQHSLGLTRRKRIQNAIRLYHSDKFRKILDRIGDEHLRGTAKEVAEHVVRVLTSLL